MPKEPIEIKIDEGEVLNYLEEYASKVKNLKPILRQVSHVMLEDIDENFETEGANQGQKWQDWTDNWRERRKKLGRGSGRIMQLEGELRESFTRKVDADSAVVGTNKEYAAIHNFGGDVKKRRAKGKRGRTGTFKMPQRRFVAWTDSLKVKVTTEIVYELKKLDYKKGIK